MKNLLESFAILLVGLLSLLIVYLIVQYNMIEDQVIEEMEYTVSEKRTETKEAKAANYLDDLEGYGEDVDVEVDATKESTTNTVSVRSEEKNTDLSDVVDDKSKSSYMKNLENYADKAEDEKLEKAKPDTEDNSGEPQKLEHEEIVDEVGMAIDAALDNL